MKRKMVVGSSKEETIKLAIDHFIKTGVDAIKDHSAYFVALSGGSTPKTIYEALAKDHQKSLDWSKVHLFFSDERSVPPDSDESNYKMAISAGLNTLVTESQIHRMVAEKEIEKNALKYEKKIKEVLENRPFDLVMLGMGEDGHTASLFPGTKALDETERLVVVNYVESKNTHRMTMTYPCINSAHHIAIYVIGDSKREILEKILKTESIQYPIQKIDHKAAWFTDQDAVLNL